MTLECVSPATPIKKSQPVSLPADFHDNASFKNYTNVVVVVILKRTATKNI